MAGFAASAPRIRRGGESRLPREAGQNDEVGMAGFEPAASCFRNRRAYQAALHPVMFERVRRAGIEPARAFRRRGFTVHCLPMRPPADSRDGRIRTGAPLHPRQVRYSAALRPESPDVFSYRLAEYTTPPRILTASLSGPVFRARSSKRQNSCSLREPRPRTAYGSGAQRPLVGRGAGRYCGYGRLDSVSWSAAADPSWPSWQFITAFMTITPDGVRLI